MFADIDAQPAAVRVLSQAASSERLAQAYLFAGPDGVGKQKAAIALAKSALCASAAVQTSSAGAREHSASCEICARIDSGIHPDVRVFAPRDEGDRNLQVEYLRNEVLPLTKFAPFESKRAFFIFPEADLSFPPHHAEAANAMLKTLEEPRPAVCFVLLSARPDRLLPTIRSRCQRVRFGALPHETLARILEASGVAQDVRAPAIALAGGSASRALSLASDGRAQSMLDWALRIHELLGAGNGARDPGIALELAEELSRRDDRDLVLESLALFYRDVAAHGLGLPGSERRFGPQPGIAAAAQHVSAGIAAERVAAITTLFDDFLRNANPQIALDGFLLGLP